MAYAATEAVGTQVAGPCHSSCEDNERELTADGTKGQQATVQAEIDETSVVGH